MGNALKRTFTQIDIDNLQHNLCCVKKQVPNSEIMAIVKADAYGHGAPFIAKILYDDGVRYFGVSNLDEAIQLRTSGICGDILILGYTPPQMFEALVEYDITQTVMSYEFAKLLSDSAVKLNKKIKVHIKTDTGMGRLGFLCNSSAAVLECYSSICKTLMLANLDFEGIYTHFAEADDAKSDFTAMQYQLFLELISKLDEQGHYFKFRHCCNSAAIINFKDMKMNMVRPGIILYGLYPAMGLADIGILPIMSFKTTISQIKVLEPNSSVSYSRTYKTCVKTVVATLPIGYADGFPRQMSNKGRVLINDKMANIIGNVCMDMTMVDVTGIDDILVNQVVTVFGKDISCSIPVEEISEKMRTINYETVCLIGKRVPRIYIKDGKELQVLNYITIINKE